MIRMIKMNAKFIQRQYYEQTLMILFQYVRFTIDFDIIYKIKSSVNESSNNNESFKLKTFLDFDYVVDKFNKKLILEYVYMFVEELITWMNRKQKSIVTSIIEAKYMILSICAKEDLWLIQLLKNIKYSKYLEIEFNQVFIVENIKHKD